MANELDQVALEMKSLLQELCRNLDNIGSQLECQENKDKQKEAENVTSRNNNNKLKEDKIHSHSAPVQPRKKVPTSVDNESHHTKKGNPVSKVTKPNYAVRNIDSFQNELANRNVVSAPVKKDSRSLSSTSNMKSPVISTASSLSQQPVKTIGSKLNQQNSKINNIQPRSSISLNHNQKNLQMSSKRSTNTPKQNLLSLTNRDPLRPFREVVDRAIKEHKTFTICGSYNSIRRALLARGWIEKIHVSYSNPYHERLRRLQALSINELLAGINNKDLGPVYKRMIISKLLAGHQVDFYWEDMGNPYKFINDKVKLTIINKFRRGTATYASKRGLCETSKHAHWYQKPGTSNVKHPRTYCLSGKQEPSEFIMDFNLSAAMSLLKWVVETYRKGKQRLLSTAGKIPLQAFNFAVDECLKAVQKAEHADIDCTIFEALPQEWNQFLEYFYSIIHVGNHFKKKNDSINDIKMAKKAQAVLEKLQKHFPHLHMDGMMNIWILKPVGGSQGVGIHICRTLQYILKVVRNNVNRRYIIQKYIEKPLLIYETKFDIRQWFLISCTYPLTIWMYRECYLRFSSQTFNLRKLHEAIHLTNNSVQCRYQNKRRSDMGLPQYCMWDSYQFKKYLKEIGHPNVYQNIIYPGMKHCITGAILANQENLDKRRNCFELYGADFMLTEDFHPWLLEINSKPALYASTPVTARMCPAVLEDTIKVIIDTRRNPKANTGNFELIYKEMLMKLPKIDIQKLALQGTPISRDYFYEHETSSSSALTTTIHDAQRKVSRISNEMKALLRNLLELVRQEKMRREESDRLGDKSEVRCHHQPQKTDPKLNNKPGINLDQGDTTESSDNFKSCIISEDEADILEEALTEIKEPQAFTEIKQLLTTITS